MNFYNFNFEPSKYRMRAITKLPSEKEKKLTPEEKLNETIFNVDWAKLGDIILSYARDTEKRRKPFYTGKNNKRYMHLVSSHTSGDKRFLDLEEVYKMNKDSKAEINKILFNGKNQLEKTTSMKYIKQRTVLTRKIGTWLEMFLMSIKWDDLNLEANTLKIDKQNRKLSKEFGRWLVEQGLSEQEKENILQELSKIWGKKEDIKFLWSTKPSDFMRQSLGTTWNSCHRFEHYTSQKDAVHEDYHILRGTGSSSFPWVHHALDKTSTILILTSKVEPRIQNRVMIHIDTKEKVAAIGRAYPNPTEAAPAVDYAIKYLESKGFKVLNKTARGEHGSVIKGFHYSSGYAGSSTNFIYGYKDFEADSKITKNENNAIGVTAKTVSQVLKSE